MKPRRQQNPEQSLQTLVLDWLRAEHILAFRMNTGVMAAESNGRKRIVRFGVPGMSDVLAFAGTHPVWIELKSPTGRQSDEQKSFQAQVEEAGHTYVLARSLEDVTKVVRNRLQ